MEHLLLVSLCVLLLNICHSEAESRFCPNGGLVDPRSLTVIAGTDVELSCGNSSADAASVRWTLNGRALEGREHRVEETGGALVLPRVAPSDSGLYICHGEGMRFLQHAALLVGHRPEKPSVSCSSKNPHAVTCSWTEARRSELPTYFRVNTTFGREHLECRRGKDLPPHTCALTVDPLAYGRYIVTVTAINPLGCAHSNSANFDLASILKPDPPADVQLRWKERALHVSWRYPDTWTEDRVSFPLTFEVCYKVAAARVCNKGPLLEVTEMTITDVLPSKNYVVQVSATEKFMRKRRSDWSPEARIAAIEDSPTLDKYAGGNVMQMTTMVYTENDTASDNSSQDPPNPAAITQGVGRGQKLYIAIGCTSVFFLTTIAFIVAVIYTRKRLAPAAASFGIPRNGKPEGPAGERGTAVAAAGKTTPAAAAPPSAADPEEDVLRALCPKAVAPAAAAGGQESDSFYNVEYFYRGVELEGVAVDSPSGVVHVVG